MEREPGDDSWEGPRAVPAPSADDTQELVRRLCNALCIACFVAAVALGFVVHVTFSSTSIDTSSLESAISSTNCGNFASCFDQGLAGGYDAVTSSKVDCGAAWADDSSDSRCAASGITRNRWLSVGLMSGALCLIFALRRSP